MNILIVKTSAIGDVTHTLPALNALRKHYPDAHITWLIEEAAADVVVGHQALNRVLISKRKRWVRELMGKRFFATLQELRVFIKELRDTEYDLLIDFQGLLKSGVWVCLARAKRKVGFGRGMEHSEMSYIFLNERIPPVDMNKHALLRERMLLDAIGIQNEGIIFDFPIDDKNRFYVEGFLRKYGVDERKPLIAIHPKGTWETKLWDNKKFALVADSLIAQNKTVVFTGSPTDRDDIDAIISLMRNDAINLAGETNLKTLAALYKQTKLLLSVDTGPMHIAAAVQTPVVAVFGPTAPWRTGPFGHQHKVLRTEIDCSPCFKRECETRECMRQISVEQVLDEVKNILDKNGDVVFG